MPGEHVEAVRAVYRRWSEGDFRASVELLDSNVVLVHHPDLDVGTYLGRDEVVAYTRRMLEPWRELTMQAEKIVAAGDSVLVDVFQRGVGTTSGIPTELRYFMLWSFRGPKVIRLESFRDRSEALAAAGLEEKPRGAGRS